MTEPRPPSDPTPSADHRLVLATVPWFRPVRSDRPADDDLLDGFDVDRPMVFVPAIMSVGLVFSVVTLLRDLFRWSGGRARERRTLIEAGAVVSELLGEPEPEPDDIGILSRPSYLIAAITLVAGAAYVAIGSTLNFLRDHSYVRDIGWLLALSLGLAVMLGFMGGVSLAVFRSWPHPPPWTMGSLRTAPLTTTPGQRGLGPSWWTTAAVGGAAIFTFIISLMVGSGRSVAMDIDEPIARWIVEAEWVGRLGFFDVFGLTPLSIAFVVFIGFAGFRCRVMALSYPVAFAVGWLGGAAIREIVERPRPGQLTDIESFPSGHMIQAVFIAGLVPLAIDVLFSDRRLAILSRFVLIGAAVASGLHRVHQQTHWPLDVLAGVGVGLIVVLGTHWAIAHHSWHGHCGSCPWSPHPSATPWRRGVFQLSESTASRIGRLAVVGALVAAAGLAVATGVVGLPSDPEGSGLASAISGPVQLTLAATMGLAGLIAVRFRAPAAFLMAFAATGLGLVAAIEYQPILAVALTTLLLIPAVLCWLAWQPNETLGSISALAAITMALLTATALGTRAIYDYFFGPTHPPSAVAELELSEGRWAWLGSVQPRSATIVVGGLDNGEPVELWYRALDESAPPPNPVPAVADDQGLARFQLSGLAPDTDYGYDVIDPESDDDDDDDDEHDGGDDGSLTPAARFHTFDEGPQSLIVTLGSCTRTGSNGAVFDRIVAEDPDLFLSLGDLHYSNLESSDPAAHIAAYGRALSQPAQAQVFSSIPTAYVWDDHDYGPNDADSRSPSRAAVSRAYRQAVPHYGVDPDPNQSIAQAFTVGRVRFVLSDTRSFRDETTMLGEDQLGWLIEELVSSARTHGLVVWANPTPWVAAERVGADDWGGYPSERQTISDALAAAGVDNLVMVSGDAHMVAIDDGSNSDYSTIGGGGFPVLHAAALDRPGSVKGGPYSHGAAGGGGQYGKLEITDTGGSAIRVRLSGHDWRGDELLGFELEILAEDGLAEDG